MKGAVVRARVEPSLKEEAEVVFEREEVPNNSDLLRDSAARQAVLDSFQDD